MKVLFLDDDEFRHVVVRLDLRKIGARLTAVRTVAEALRYLEREKFDLVLLDHDLDGKVMTPSGPGTGFEVAARLPKTVNRGTRVIVHTLNEAGAKKMVEAIGPNAEWVPFQNLSRVLEGMRGG
jgi:CheY-like chemotaxis protein